MSLKAMPQRRHANFPVSELYSSSRTAATKLCSMFGAFCSPGSSRASRNAASTLRGSVSALDPVTIAKNLTFKKKYTYTWNVPEVDCGVQS